MKKQQTLQESIGNITAQSKTSCSLMNEQERFLIETDHAEAIRINEENKLEQHWQDDTLNFIYPWFETIDHLAAWEQTI